jgi:ethanolamine ammonia-lyase small subunit
MIDEKEIKSIVEAVIKELGIGKNQVVDGSLAKKAEGDDGKILPDLCELNLAEWFLIPDPAEKEGFLRIKRKTPARLGVWRAGTRYKLEPWIRFRADLAAAKDAVLTEVDSQFIKKLGLFEVQTVVKDKDEYLTRPDLGRKLSEEAKKKILEECPKSPNVQLIVVDGLSSTAIEANAADFIPSFMQAIKTYNLTLGKPFFIKFGRVAVMDEVGELLSPDVVVELVGERPGLVTAKSMSAYMCYKPNKNTIESDRMLVSNIHEGGMPPVEAGAHVASIVKKIYDAKASGVKLTDQ